MTSTAPQNVGIQDAASFDTYRRLREDIISCRLMPNEHLRFEGLRANYGAGVGTLREALSHLVSDGLVRTKAGHGFFVSPVAPADLVEITEWRVEFETKAITLAIRNGDDNWEAEIVSAFHLLARAGLPEPSARPEVWADFRERHRRFHDALVAACGSPWLLHFRNVLFDQALRYQALSLIGGDPTRDDKNEQHRAIMEAALNREDKLAAVLVEQHIRKTAEIVLSNLPRLDLEVRAAGSGRGHGRRPPT